MRCSQFQEWLRELLAYPTPSKIADYLRADLAGGGSDVDPETPRQRHLARCPRCRERVRRALKYWSLLGLFCRDVTPGPDLERRLAGRIRAERADPCGDAPRRPRARVRAAMPASREERRLYADMGGALPVVGWLLAVEGELRGRACALVPGENAIGRDEACDVHVADASVAPLHASIVCAVHPGGVAYFVLDHASEAGIYRNDGPERVTWGRLEDGDILRLGEVRLRFKALVGVPATT